MKRSLTSIALIVFAVANAVSYPARSEVRASWTRIWSDRTVVVARDIGAPVQSSSDGARKYRLAIGFKATRQFKETPSLNAATADFVLLQVRVHCEEKRIEYLDAQAMTLTGGGGGPLNKYFEKSDDFSAQLPAPVGKAIIAGTCGGQIGKERYSAMYELMNEYRRR